MAEINNSHFSVEEIMKKIKEEVAEKNADTFLSRQKKYLTVDYKEFIKKIPIVGKIARITYKKIEFYSLVYKIPVISKLFKYIYVNRIK